MADLAVVAVPGHDTACAFLALPAQSNDLIVSCGTWSLIGCENDRPLTQAAALEAKVCNERCADGGFRPLIAVSGLWVLDRYLSDADARPRSEEEWDQLLAQAAAVDAGPAVLDLQHSDLVNPPAMDGALRAQLDARDLAIPASVPAYVRLICESLGAAHARAARSLAELSGRRFQRVLLTGGGARNRLLCQCLAEAVGLPVSAYAIEGTAIGNLASQLIALQEVDGQADFRLQMHRSIEPRQYSPGRPILSP
jgi:rhamnulokinase